MKSKIALLMLFVGGITASVAVASPSSLTGIAQKKPPKVNKAAKKTTICHYTGSRRNPYRRITVSNRALKGHMKHGRDIIPATPGRCPGFNTTTVTVTVTTTVPCTCPTTTTTVPTTTTTTTAPTTTTTTTPTTTTTTTTAPTTTTTTAPTTTTTTT